MKPFFRTLVLILMLFFKEIEEASGLLKSIVNKKRSPSNDNEDARTLIIPSSHNIRMENRGLDLPITPSSLDNSLIRNGALEHNQEEPGQGAADLFNHYYRGKAPIPSESGEKALELFESHQQPRVPNSNKPEEKGSRKSKKKESSTNPRKPKVQKSLPQSPTLSDNQALILPGTGKSIAPFKDHQPESFEKDFREYNAYLLFESHYPNGVPDPQPQTDASSGKLPPALHEIDDSVTPGGYRRRKKDM